jgi:4-aminobutyrate aminotransferase-like enzyme
MEKAVALVRAAGGLYVADEVQPGFGRTGGRMWGHQHYGPTPDLVTLGKPMGNGHPLGGVVGRADLFKAFGERAMYFNTFGGNPVSCAVGIAVLEVIERENLVEHAREVGDYVQAGLQKLAAKHGIVGDIRGRGLFFGAELVKDRKTKEPATEETKTVINAMRERGVLMSRTGRHDNILKIRPPMPFANEHADLLLSTLDDVLGAL